MRTVLVCVRTPLAAQSIAACAARLGVGAVRTATSESEVMARLSEQPAELILADAAIGRPDPVAFTRRVLARAPRAVLLLFGNEEPHVATASVAAGARGVVRTTEHDPVVAVVKALLLIGSPRRGERRDPAGATGPAVRPGPGGAAGAVGAGEGSSGAGAGESRGGLPRAGGVPGTPEPAGARPGGSGPNGPAGAAAGRAAPTVVPVQRGDAATDPALVPTRRVALTERELQVLRGMADGKSNAEIGRDLYVSEDTVKTHARRLFRKLGVRDRAHAVAVGFRSGALG